MTPLTKKALTGLLRFQFFVALMLFVPAGSLNFWEAWVYWIIFFLSTLTMSLYLLKHDPALVERRMKAGPAAQKRKKTRKPFWSR